MVIRLVSQEGREKKKLEFSKLAKFEYLIVSKEFEKPLDGASGQVIGGKWYLFSLMVHEFATIDEDTGERVDFKGQEQVIHFQSDSKNKETGDITQGTVLRALLEAPVGQKLKITMFKNEENLPRYKVEVVDGDVEQPIIKEKSTPTPKEESKSLFDKMKMQAETLKANGIPVDLIGNTVGAMFPDASPEDVEAVVKEVQ